MDRIPFFGCISLIEREDRFRFMSGQFSKMGLADKVHWHRAHRHKAGGRVGCFESHLAVFKAALDSGASFALICEDDVRLSNQWNESLERLMTLIDSGIKWEYVSLMNSGGEAMLNRPMDVKILPPGIRRGSFYFARCYAISKFAMERAVAVGITNAHVDLSLAIASWGNSFIVRPAAVKDVPFESDNDWSEGGCGPWLAGKMQGWTHLPCVITDRVKLEILPRLFSLEKRERICWKKFMSEPGVQWHMQEEWETSHPPAL
eukprot:TRINITY_DN1130_c0_g1_i1.p1 TRINITY_DN1130_c0_g1~~TRINITY_DN1130_c0_g1_i1.p1  ORF type:complete len:261 (+),score=31.58 TRINITY_DN1130_c0_g1_i1:102-884(+)